MRLNLCLKRLMILMIRYCCENYEYNYNINAYIEKVSAAQEETNILQEAMEE